MFFVDVIHALPQQMHNIDDFALWFRFSHGLSRLNGFGLTGFDLLVDHPEQILVIFIAILFGIPLAGHSLN